VYRVLVAEDDPEMRRLIVDVLRRDGYEVAEAIDGGDLAAKLAESLTRNPQPCEFDVVISDMRMPGSNGLEIFEQIAAAGWTLSTVLMTAFGDEETRRRAKRAGAVYLEKPLWLDDLRDAVSRLARR
jgi:CheY-like chemotaxis protein